MAKMATISMRVEGGLKADAERIFRELGLTTTDAIKIFLSAVRRRRGIPFDLQVDDPAGSGGANSATARRAAVKGLVGRYPDIVSGDEFNKAKATETSREDRKLRR